MRTWNPRRLPATSGSTAGSSSRSTPIFLEPDEIARDRRPVVLEHGRPTRADGDEIIARAQAVATRRWRRAGFAVARREEENPMARGFLGARSSG
jgi:hypothetical protein